MVGRLTGLAGDSAQSFGVGPARLTVTHAALPPTYILACSGDYPRNALVCLKFLWFASLAGQSVVILADFLPILLVRWEFLYYFFLGQFMSVHTPAFIFVRDLSRQIEHGYRRILL